MMREMRIANAIVAATALLALAGCGGSLHLKEPDPVVITGGKPAPAPAPRPKKRVAVRKDRIDVSETIQFDFSSSRVSEDSRSVLDELAAALTSHPEIKKVRIEGHTDNSGDSPHNLALSKKRAAAVLKYLVNQGIDEDRLISEGYGDTKPIASNDSEDGRAKNRRVAFVILDRAAGGKTDDDDDSGGDQ
jgi:outer membrane protein OmpA-like peptidoglycan-associated protein